MIAVQGMASLSLSGSGGESCKNLKIKLLQVRAKFVHCGEQFNIAAENFTPYCTSEIYILLGNDVLIFYREDEGEPIRYRIVRTGSRIHPALLYPIKVDGERKETYQVSTLL